jgi:hypothetical protein
MNKPLQESLKDGARIVVLAVIPILITDLNNGNGINWSVIGVTAAVSFLTFVSSWLHHEAKEEPKATRNEGIGGVTGLTGF